MKELIKLNPKIMPDKHTFDQDLMYEEAKKIGKNKIVRISPSLAKELASCFSVKWGSTLKNEIARTLNWRFITDRELVDTLKIIVSDLIIAINVYDMLVFEDYNTGSIWQECVDNITNTEHGYVAKTSNFEVSVTDNGLIGIKTTYGAYVHLKEQWTRTSETTFTKVWDIKD